MLKLGDKVRLKVAKQSVPIPFTDKRVDIDTDQIHTVTQVNNWDGKVMYSCEIMKTGLHGLPEQEFELVETSKIEPKFNIHDAVVVRINKTTRVRNKFRKTNVVSIGAQVPATIFGVGLKGQDKSRIDYHVLLDDETIAYVTESDIELKDYTLF